MNGDTAARAARRIATCDPFQVDPPHTFLTVEPSADHQRPDGASAAAWVAQPCSYVGRALGSETWADNVPWLNLSDDFVWQRFQCGLWHHEADQDGDVYVVVAFAALAAVVVISLALLLTCRLAGDQALSTLAGAPDARTALARPQTPLQRPPARRIGRARHGTRVSRRKGWRLGVKIKVVSLCVILLLSEVASWPPIGRWSTEKAEPSPAQLVVANTLLGNHRTVVGDGGPLVVDTVGFIRAVRGCDWGHSATESPRGSPRSFRQATPESTRGGDGGVTRWWRSPMALLAPLAVGLRW